MFVPARKTCPRKQGIPKSGQLRVRGYFILSRVTEGVARVTFSQEISIITNGDIAKVVYAGD